MNAVTPFMPDCLPDAITLTSGISIACCLKFASSSKKSSCSATVQFWGARKWVEPNTPSTPSSPDVELAADVQASANVDDGDRKSPPAGSPSPPAKKARPEGDAPTPLRSSLMLVLLDVALTVIVSRAPQSRHFFVFA